MTRFLGGQNLYFSMGFGGIHMTCGFLSVRDPVASMTCTQIAAIGDVEAQKFTPS